MKNSVRRHGAVNSLYVKVAAALVMLIGLSVLLMGLGRSSQSPTRTLSSTKGVDNNASKRLFVYCAAGIRKPVEQAASDYERIYGLAVQLQYSGSNTLLNQIEVAKIGDLYVAADDDYIERAQEKGLVKEAIPIASQRPVIAVRKGNPKNIHSVDDLLRDDVRTALGNPDQAAIGKKVRTLLTKSQHWKHLEEHITQTGTFLPTVPEVANSIKIGSVDAGIVWDSLSVIYPEFEMVPTPELDLGTAHTTIGVLTSSKNPTASLHFARYLTARDKGLTAFKNMGYTAVDGDKWAEIPEINFYCGAVNRRAVESVIKKFEQREGVTINTKYNGCGILTSEMKIIRDQRQGSGFPDTYMACDVYYLEEVKDWFQEAVNVSDTQVVIAVQKGNPKDIKSVQDLTKPGLRIVVGQPEQCTIGVLTRKLLTSEGIYDEVMKRVFESGAQKASSAMLIPDVITGVADAVLCYATDTQAERDQIDVVTIDSPSAMAIQPFSIARSSDHKYLSRRLYQEIANSRVAFEAAGFHWRLNGSTINQRVEN